MWRTELFLKLFMSNIWKKKIFPSVIRNISAPFSMNFRIVILLVKNQTFALTAAFEILPCLSVIDFWNAEFSTLQNRFFHSHIKNHNYIKWKRTKTREMDEVIKNWNRKIEAKMLWVKVMKSRIQLRMEDDREFVYMMSCRRFAPLLLDNLYCLHFVHW